MRNVVLAVMAAALMGWLVSSARAADAAKKADSKPAAAKSEKAAGGKKADQQQKSSGDSAKPASNKGAEEPAQAESKKTNDLSTIARRLAGLAQAEKKAQKKTEKQKAEKSKKATVVRFVLRGEYPEGPAAAGVFGELRVSLGTLVERIAATADDKDVAAVELRIEDLQMGRGKINELRGAVAKVRKAGKPVFAEICSAETSEYLLASACDEVIMPPSGMLMLPGVRAEMTFYKGLMDKLGLQFDVLQEGKYKGAGEPFSRTNMSGPLRESMTALVDDTYDCVAATIGQDRNQPDYRIKTLMDQGMFTAQTAKEAGLVDRVLYFDEMAPQLRKRLKVDSLNVVTDYKKKKLDTDFSGIGGMMKLMEMVLGGGKTAEADGTEPKIAVVYAVGEITEGKSVSDMWGDHTVGSSTLTAVLRGAAENAKVKAVVLRIDSPGGSAVASDLIWREIVRMKKPVVASMSDVAGSGGYYIAMGANKILAEPSTITGSIGVIGGKLAMGKLLDKIGVNTEVIARGKLSGAMSMLKPFTADERAAWTKLLDETYAQFVAKAAKGRKMSVKKLGELAQGRIYSGRMAAANGLVDQLGTLADAIAEAKKLAHIKPGEKIEVEILPPPKNFFEQLFNESADQDEVESLMPGVGHLLAKARILQKLFAEPSLMLMPCQVELK